MSGRQAYDHVLDSVLTYMGVRIYQDLSYDESLSGQPGAWPVKKNMFICMQSEN